MDASVVSKSFEINLKIGVRIMAIRRRPVTIFAYFCILEFGRSISITVASRIKRIIFVTHSFKKSIKSHPYRIIIVKFPAAIITVILKKNISDTIPSAAKTYITLLLIISKQLIIGPPPKGWRIAAANL